MQNNFHEFEELVFFDLWIPDSGLRVPVPDSGFRFPGFRVAHCDAVNGLCIIILPFRCCWN